MTKLAIFDLDGTLLDTAKDLGIATNYALRNCGYPERPVEDFYQLVGRGIYNLFRGAVLPRGLSNEELFKRYPEVDQKLVDKMASYFIPFYDKHKCDYTNPYPGIPEMLDSLAAHGVAFGVASNKYQKATEEMVLHYFGSHEFVKIYGQREGQPLKPDPAIVDEIMACVPSVKKSEVVYVGDSNVDMQTGHNAGVRTIGVLWGFRTREELAACHPSALVSNAAELTDEILKG